MAGRRRFLAWSKLTKALTTEATISGEDSPPTSTAEDRGHFSEYSAALLESLTHHKTAAGAAELAAQPTVALAALVHALKLSNFRLDLHLYRGKSSLQVSMSQALLESAFGSPALAQLDQQGQNWLTMLPPDSAELWRWCLEQDQGTLIQLLAYCMARSLNGGQLKNNNVLRSLITAPFSISENHRCPVGGSSWETKQIVRTR